LAIAEREGATSYDVSGVAFGHHGEECSFEAIVKHYSLTNDRALVLLGKIVNGSDSDNMLWQQPEGPGLEAIAEGFRLTDDERNHLAAVAAACDPDPGGIGFAQHKRPQFI
jgi:hypothetical protein